jgi:hypothetical protein
MSLSAKKRFVMDEALKVASYLFDMTFDELYENRAQRKRKYYYPRAIAVLACVDQPWIHIKHREIAEYIGCSVPQVSHTLANISVLLMDYPEYKTLYERIRDHVLSLQGKEPE